MNLTIYVNDDDTYTASDIMKKIAEEKRWAILAGPEDAHGTDFKIKDEAGRIGTYYVEGDLLTWDDNHNETEYQLFDNEALGYIGPSLAEWITDTDGTTGDWGDGDDGRRYFYTQF